MDTPRQGVSNPWWEHCLVGAGFESGLPFLAVTREGAEWSYSR